MCWTSIDFVTMSLQGSLVCGVCFHMAVNLGDRVGSDSGCQRILQGSRYGRCTKEEVLWFQYGSLVAKNWDGHFYCYKCAAHASPTWLQKAHNKTSHGNWCRPCQSCLHAGACWTLVHNSWVPGWNLSEATALVERQAPPVPLLAVMDVPSSALPSSIEGPLRISQTSTGVSSSQHVSSPSQVLLQHDDRNLEEDTLLKEINVLKVMLETEQHRTTSAQTKVNFLDDEMMSRFQSLQKTVEALHKNVEQVVARVETSSSQNSVIGRRRSQSCHAAARDRSSSWCDVIGIDDGRALV